MEISRKNIIRKCGDTEFVIQELEKILGDYKKESNAMVIITSYVLMKMKEKESVEAFDYDGFAQELKNENEVAWNIFKTLKESECWDDLMEMADICEADVFRKIVSTETIDVHSMKMDSAGTSPLVMKLVDALLDIHPDEKVLDVGFEAGLDITNLGAKHSGALFYGIDENRLNVCAAVLRAKVMGLNMHVEQNSVLSSTFRNSIPKMDKICYMSVCVGRVKDLLSQGYEDELPFGRDVYALGDRALWMEIGAIMEVLAENGRAVISTPNVIRNGVLDTKYIAYFVRNKMLEAVITLPVYYPGSGLKMQLFVMGHNNTSVKLIDGASLSVEKNSSDFSEEVLNAILDAYHTDDNISKTVTTEEMRTHGYSVSCYDYEEENEGDVRFENVITNISRTVICSPKYLEEHRTEEQTNINVLMIKDIEDGIVSENLASLQDLDTAALKACIPDRAVILAKNGNPMKSAVIRLKEGQKIVPSVNMYVITVDETMADPYYVSAYLNSKKGQEALMKKSSGAVLPSISISQLKSMYIPLPPMDEQRKYIEHYKDLLNKLEEARMQETKAKNELYTFLND